ncbi:MAG: small, acid-soluble spore protein, alpha/beta type [Clostridia bacterium]|jgi:small acid-soluble spore protein F (minor alpha/beta-type SASP)|nr:small, acid-soluble spore protein, alpha/beta type [Clostridia bacterium]
MAKIMSPALKTAIAKELGVFSPQVAGGDFGEVSSRDCGNMIKTAVQMAESRIGRK